MKAQNTVENRVMESKGRVFQYAKRVVGRNVTLEMTSSDGDVFSITADAAQLRCALTNLVVNARDAMPEAGAITVRMHYSQADLVAAQAQGANEASFQIQGYTGTNWQPIPITLRGSGPTCPDNNWIDGVSGGTDLLLTDDGCTVNRIPLGFPFRFYGVIYNDAYVCANGFVAFNTPAGSAQFTDAYAVGLGADLNPDSASAPGTGHVYAKADSLSSPRRLIVTWNGVYTYATTDPQTFEIVLFENPTGEDGRVLFQYKQLTNPPAHITGIDSLGGTSSLYYASALANLLAVEFRPPGTSPECSSAPPTQSTLRERWPSRTTRASSPAPSRRKRCARIPSRTGWRGCAWSARARRSLRASAPTSRTSRGTWPTGAAAAASAGPEGG